MKQKHMTKEQSDAVIAVLRTRKRNHGKKCSEVDFLCGAMTVLNVLFPGEKPDQMSSMVPPMWVLAPLYGRSVLEDRK